MGYTIARFFIVHTWEKSVAEQARVLACEIFTPSLVGPVLSGIVNEAHGFIVWTSGSKYGWYDDEIHVAKIDAMIAKLSAMEHPPHWTRVDDGEDLGDLSAEHASDGDYSHTYRRARVGKEH